MRQKGLVILVIAFIQAAFLYFAFTYGNTLTKDSAEYLQQSVNLRNYGSWYCGDFSQTIQPELYSRRTPLYGFFLMLLSFVTESTLFIGVVQSVLSLINIYILMKMLEATGCRSMWLILLPLLFFPTQFIYSAVIMSEMLFQTCIMTAVFSLLMYLKDGKKSYFLYYIIAITCAALVKPVFMAFPVVGMAMMLYLERKNMSRVIFLHVIPVMIIATVAWVNYKNTGYYEYSSIGRKLSVNYHAYLSSAFNHGEEKAIKDVERIERHCSDEADYRGQACCIQAGASRVISANKGAFILLTLKGMLYFFIDHSRYDVELIRGQTTDTYGMQTHFKEKGIEGLWKYLGQFNPFYITYFVLSVIFNVLLLTGFIHFILNKKIPLPFRIVTATFILYVMLMTGMTGGSRFRMPVFLLIAGSCMYTFCQSFQRKNKGLE